MQTNKWIIITPGIGATTNSSISQIDLKWFTAGIGTNVFSPNSQDLRSTIYNWVDILEPVIQFGGVGTFNGQNYFVGPYTDYLNSFSGISSAPSVKIYPISGKIFTRNLYISGYISDNNNSLGLANSVLTSTSTGVIWADPSQFGSIISGSISTNQVAFGSGNKTIQGSNNFWFNGSNLGIGTSSPLQPLTVIGNASISGITTASQFSGSGLTLNNLNASNLASGTVPTGVISGSYTGITSVGVLSQLTVTGITTASQFSGSGLTLNNLNASNLASGTVPAGVVSGSYTGITSVGVLSQLTVSGLTTLKSSLYDFYNSPGVAKNVLTSTGTGIAWSSSSSVGIVTGSGAANQIAYWNNNNQIGGISTFVYFNGNVGIGSASPPNILTVLGGDVIINYITVGLGSLQLPTNTVFGLQALSNLLGVSSSANLAVGYQAGQYFNGSSNVLIGYKAGQGSATTVPINSFTTYVGALAGQYINGGSNVILGYNANAGSAATWVNSIASVVVGVGAAVFVNLSRSVVLGSQAMVGGSATTVLTVTDGIILGFQAGYYLNSINNVVIGNYASQGTATTPNTSSNSVVIGYSAGKYLNAAYNVVIGLSALQGQITGTNVSANNIVLGAGGAQFSQSSNNVIIGYQALQGSSTTFNAGDNNSIIGFQAGQFLNSANNTSFGSKTLQGTATTYVTGGNNVAIGYQAGINFSSAFNNTLLGSATSGLATGSYQIAIGYNVLPTGSNLGAFGGNLNASRTDLGLGTFTALSRLHLETLAAGNKGIYIAGFASQTANLLQIDATTSGANYVTVGAAGSVGIGTATPTQSLHILNSMRLSGGLYDSVNSAGLANSVLTSTGAGVIWAPIFSSIGGSIATSQVAYGSGVNGIQGSNTFKFDGTNLTIGTTISLAVLTVQGGGSFSGIVTSLGFYGPGTNITNLNASNLASGTVPTGVISGSYIGITSVGVLSQLTVTGITTASQFSGSGLTLNNLNASNLASGTVPTGVISGSYTGITSVGVLNQLTVSGLTTLKSSLYDFYNSPGSAQNILTSTGAGIAWSSYASVGVVTGSGTQSQIAYWNGNNQIIGVSTFVFSNGNIGIGTTNPQQNLHVNGTARVDGTLIVNSNAFDTKNQLLFAGASTATISTSFVGISSIIIPTGYQLTIEGKVNGWLSTTLNESGKYFGVFFNAIGVASAVSSVDITSKYTGSNGNFNVLASGNTVTVAVKSDSSSNSWLWKTQFNYLLTQNA